MPKLIIYIKGRRQVHGFKRQEFFWSAKHGELYVYKNREFTFEEFNKEAEEIFIRYHKKEMKPLVKVIDLDHVPTTLFAPAARVADSPDLPPVELDDESAISKAEEVLLRLAPNRLKKKPGPLPALAGV